MALSRTGVCQRCARRHGRTSWHHLVGKDLGGDDVVENLAELQGSGTSGCHGLVQTLDRKACSDLRRRLTPEQEEYIVGRKGRDWLERYYPTPLP